MNHIDYPLIIENVLPTEQFNSLSDNLISGWQLNNISNLSDNSYYKNFWGIQEKETDLILVKSGITISLKIQKFLKKKIKLLRCHINGQTFGQSGEFHVDFIENDIWTFILFCCDYWETNWGGEFVCHNPISKKYLYVPYIPNSGCLIPSNWDHYGSSPNDQTRALRTSIGFSYCDDRIYKKMKEKYKLKL